MSGPGHRQRRAIIKEFTMKLFICKVCGYLEFNEAPGKCPVCSAPKSAFEQNDDIFRTSKEKSPEAEVKHIPAVTVKKECKLIEEGACTDIVFRIGSKLHPMEEKHFIQFADCYLDQKFVARVHFTPGVFAAGTFHLKEQGKKVQLVENCNIHGYWMSEAEL